MPVLPSIFRRAGQTAKSAALVLCGMAGLARAQYVGDGAVLTFHGLYEGEPLQGVGDESLHLQVVTFRAVCEHLAANYQVMSLPAIAAALRAGEKLPPQAVGISFDDGYGSNHALAFPVLRELGLPATIFLTTGFLDGSVPLWFQQVDLALAGRCRNRLRQTLAHLKTVPDDELRSQVSGLVKGGRPAPSPAPVATRPLSWDQVREMHGSGLIEFGAHTHTHPILARCDVEKQRWEIETSRDRIAEELGVAPRMFAFPNGGPGDCTPETQRLLTEAGFESAWSMVSGRVSKGWPLMHLPRYGAPRTVWEAEATVSGAFEMLRRWRGGAA